MTKATITGVPDIQRISLEYALNLYNSLKSLDPASGLTMSSDGRIRAPGLRTRARSLPPLILSSSLIAVTAFALSKIDKLRALDQAYDVLAGKFSGSNIDDLVDDVKSEGKGYAVMVALIARILNDVKYCTIDKQNKQLAVSLAECLLALQKKGESLIAERIVLQVMYEFKKYIEALVVD